MLQNVTLLAIVAIHTAANEPPKVRQVMNKIHRNVGSTHPRIRTRTNADFQRDPEVMDGWIQYSSLEHAGLGAYGDEVNPWADRQWMAMMWCATKPSGFFFFGPGPAKGLERCAWFLSPNSRRDFLAHLLTFFGDGTIGEFVSSRKEYQ